MGNSLNAKYGLKRVINASGRMSILGVSTPTDAVMDAMKFGGQNYVEIDDLVHKAGQHIANLIDAEDAVVVNSASSGIALSIAALVTEGSRRKSERLHQEPLRKNEVILLKGHNVQYGAPIETMVYLGGGKLVEVGYANEGKAHHIEEAISENTAAILYVKSHHAVQKNMISAEEAWAIAQQYQVPLIIDAAAEADLKKYVQIADLAIYSGSKAIEGPTSGIVAGKTQFIDWIKLQLHCIGRSMKVGKETTFGLLQAMDEYFVKEDHSEAEKATLGVLLKLNDLQGVSVAIVQDEAGRLIFRARIKVDENVVGKSAADIDRLLEAGDIAIYTRNYGVRQGFFDIDPRSLKNDDGEILYATLHQLLGGTKND